MSEDREIIEEFVVESLEHIETIEPLLLEMEKSGTAERGSIDEVFRAIHSIKGAAGFLGLTNIQELAHAMESLLMRLRDGTSSLRSEMCDPLLQGVERLTAQLRGLPASPGEPALELIEALERILAAEEVAAGGDQCEAAGSFPGGSGAHADDVATVAVLFGEVARDLGFLDDDGIAQVLELQQTSPIRRTFGMVAVAHGLLTLEQTERVREEQTLRIGRSTVSPVATGVSADGAAGPISGPAASGAGERRPDTIRVSVTLLDKLMDLAGELVLGRNQLRQAIEGLEASGVHSVFQSVDRLTTELQDQIMNTRMQPIRVLFDKLPRLVRDVARKLAKRAEVVIEGGDVELDRSILEALSDPLTHLLRNAVDHGLESPSGRTAARKADVGRIAVRAFHEGGQVVVEIEDDGRGIDPVRVRRSAVEKGSISAADAEALSEREALGLIFLPGLSTAEEVTDVSGRGVGMDVVRTNIRNLGGQIDLDSEVGRGTRVRIQLPLTLAIIPSFTVSIAGERFAIPQVNLIEVVQLRDEASTQVERIRGVEVMRIRGELLPIVRLADTLLIQRVVEPPRAHVVVLRAGARSYGLVVDELHDSEEIVVKPLSSFVKACSWFAGATILGDGGVAMILDAQGLARRAGIDREGIDEVARAGDETSEHPDAERCGLLIFSHAENEFFALPLEQLMRLEKLTPDRIERAGGREFVQHRGQTIPLLRLDQMLPVGSPTDSDVSYLLIPRHGDGRAGIGVGRIVDAVESEISVDTRHVQGAGIRGSAVLNDRLTVLLDAAALLDASNVEGL